MKKILSSLFALVLVLACVWVCSTEVNAARVDGGNCGAKLTWTIDDNGTLTISGTGTMYDYDESYAPWFLYANNISKVVIKSGITYIGKYAFLGCQYVPSVTLPKTVVSIGEGAFVYCLSLKSATIPSSVHTIGEGAFMYCSSLESVTIPSSVKTIGEGAFMYCSGLKSATIPSGVKTIGEVTFYGCTRLASVTLPSSITTIGDWAFAHCDALTTVTIPKNVSAIGEYPFCNCDSLTKINVSSDNKYFSNDAKGVLFNKNKTALLQAPGSLAGKYTIPASVKTISNAAFYNCSKMTSVTIPSQVTAIGDEMFTSCTALTAVSIPESVTSIGYAAFDSCVNLESIAIPKKVTAIGDYAFSECESLTSVTIPGGVTTLGDYAFFNCYNLSSVVISHGVVNINACAFFGAEDMTSLFIPASVKAVGNDAFRYMPYLRQVLYGGTEAQWAAIAFGEYNGALTDNTILYNQFPDVKTNAWYYGAVQFAVQKGYFSGNGDGTFGPGNNITRQDFVVVLSRIAGANLSQYSGQTSFTDVKSNAYYAKAIHWATETGIISGYNATKFGVGDALTREQLVTILSRYAAKKGVNVAPDAAAMAKLNAYSDANKVNPAMKNAVAWALQNKVISGMTSTTVGPQGKATRAQVAAILFNISSYKVIPGI